MRRKGQDRLESEGASRAPSAVPPSRARAKPQRAREPTRAALQARVAALEERVAALEKLLGQRSPPRPEPKEAPKPDNSPRCPGCHLRVPSMARGRCQWCGFVFDAFHELRRLTRNG